MDISLPNRDSLICRSLFSRGAPQQLSFISKFSLDERVRTFISHSETGLKSKKIKKDNQIKDYSTVLKSPVKTPYVYCISSDPSDKRANLAAASIAAEYLKQGNSSRGLYWHTLTGSYKDSLRDKKPIAEQKPKLLILTNLTAESTEVKLEKLRDLLELYSDIPRIVTVTGVNPLTFFNDYIRYHLNYMTYIGSSRKRTLLEQQ